MRIGAADDIRRKKELKRDTGEPDTLKNVAAYFASDFHLWYRLIGRRHSCKSRCEYPLAETSKVLHCPSGASMLAFDSRMAGSGVRIRFTPPTRASDDS